MSFIDVLDQVIIMAGNNLKTFEQHESTVGSDNPGIESDNKEEAHTAVEEASENEGLEEHLNSLSDDELRKLCLVALYGGKGDKESIASLEIQVDGRDRQWYISELKKSTQYLYLGKRMAEKHNINLKDL